MTNVFSKFDSHRRIVAASLLGGALLAAVLIAGYAWQSSNSDSRLAEAVTHTETASLLADASAEGDNAADLIGAYVLQGDEALIPRIQSHSAIALAKLTSAIASSGSDEVRQIAVEGAGLSAGAGAVIALRQAGDVEGAVAALTDLGIQFESFGAAMQASIDTQLAAAVSLTDSSQNANDTASLLLIIGIAIAIATGAALVFVASRSLLRHPTQEKPSPA